MTHLLLLPCKATKKGYKPAMENQPTYERYPGTPIFLMKIFIQHMAQWLFLALTTLCPCWPLGLVLMLVYGAGIIICPSAFCELLQILFYVAVMAASVALAGFVAALIIEHSSNREWLPTTAHIHHAHHHKTIKI